MARFEQRISEDEVTAARKKIAAGTSLRSAAAEIPCAPSTLSVRIKKAEAAEADARRPAAVRDDEQRAAQRAPEHPDAREIAALAGAVAGEVGPVEILRGALLATKASGQPDWPTRVSAARALAALRPEELEPKTAQQPTEPSIVVYDLQPGAQSVLHRARNRAAGAAVNDAGVPVSDAEAPSEQPLTSSSVHMFSYQPPDEESVLIGTWSPADLGQSPHVAAVTVAINSTDDGETAEFWRTELSAGRLPQSTETVP